VRGLLREVAELVGREDLFNNVGVESLRNRDAREPKVGQFDVALRVDKDVVWLEVVVRDLVLVQVLEGKHNLGSVHPRAGLCELFVHLQQRAQVTSGEILHHLP